MAYQRSPPSSASTRNHNTRKIDYIPSQRLRKSQSASPRSSSGDPIPRRFFPNNTPTDSGQKENNQEGGSTSRPTPTRSAALLKGEKNFMSPTISTSSKFTSSPKKNMSTERNDPFPRAHSFPTLVFADSTNVDRDNKFETSIESHLSNQGSVQGDSMDFLTSSMTMDTKLDAFFHSQMETHDPHFNRDDPGMSSFSSASSVVTNIDPCPQPYNPKTNYLSPRPRFLHYRPRPRPESYLNGNKSSGGGEEEEEAELHFSRQEEVPYLDDDDDEYNKHESDGADSSSEEVEGIQLISPTKSLLRNDSTKRPKRRFPIGLMLSSMIMAVVVSFLCFSVMDSPFMTKKDESGYVGEEVWMNISKSKPWNVHKLREDWLIFSKSILSEVISFVRESGVGEAASSTNSTFSNILVSNFVAVNYGGGGYVVSSGETDSYEHNIIFPDVHTPPCFYDEVDMNNANSLKKDDASPPPIEYDVIPTVISESRGEDEVVGFGEDVDSSLEYVTSLQLLTFDPLSNYTEESMKKADIYPAIDEPHDVELQDPVEDFIPWMEDDEEHQLYFLTASEDDEGRDENKSEFLKLEEEVTMEANEIQKSIKEEELPLLLVDEQKGDVFGMGEEEKRKRATESMNLVRDLVAIVCCVAIGAAAVATMVYKWRFVNTSVESADGVENMRRKKQKNKRESLSSSSDFNITPSYGSFMRYEKITKKNSEEGAVTTPVRRSNRIRSQITSP